MNAKAPEKTDSAKPTALDASTSHGLLSDALGWTTNNIGKPLVNQSVLNSWNAIASSTDDASNTRILPEATLYDLPKADFLSPSWFAQGISGGVGMILPYYLASRGAGKALRGGTQALKLEGKAAEILQSEHTAQITGAGLYGAARKPEEGGTRRGDALGDMAMLGIMGTGNAFGKNLNMPMQFLKRSALGFTGGAADQVVSHLASDLTLPTVDQTLKAGVSGAVLSIALTRNATRESAAEATLKLAPRANNEIPKPQTLLARGEGEGDIYDNGDGKVTKIYYDKTVDAGQKAAMYERLRAMGIKVPQIFEHGTTKDGQPALVMEKVGDGDSLKYQLRSGELSAADYKAIRKQFYAMADKLIKNKVSVDWRISNMRFENGQLYLLDPSYIHEKPLDPEWVNIVGGAVGPRS